jgi:hypothetical protein
VLTLFLVDTLWVLMEDQRARKGVCRWLHGRKGKMNINNYNNNFSVTTVRSIFVYCRENQGVRCPVSASRAVAKFGSAVSKMRYDSIQPTLAAVVPRV